jgi:hypothetical protein
MIIIIIIIIIFSICVCSFLYLACKPHAPVILSSVACQAVP